MIRGNIWGGGINFQKCDSRLRASILNDFPAQYRVCFSGISPPFNCCLDERTRPQKSRFIHLDFFVIFVLFLLYFFIECSEEPWNYCSPLLILTVLLSTYDAYSVCCDSLLFSKREECKLIIIKTTRLI